MTHTHIHNTQKRTNTNLCIYCTSYCKYHKKRSWQEPILLTHRHRETETLSTPHTRQGQLRVNGEAPLIKRGQHPLDIEGPTRQEGERRGRSPMEGGHTGSELSPGQLGMERRREPGRGEETWK